MKSPPYIQLCGNRADTSIEILLFEEYIGHLDNYLLVSSGRNKKSMKGLPDSLQAIAFDESDLHAEVFPRILHSGIVVSIVIFFERQLSLLSEILQFAKGHNLKLKDLSGSLIERFRKYCEAVIGLPFPISNDLWVDVKGVIEIRNCLVHNDGHIIDFNKRPVIEAFARRHKLPLIEDDWLVTNNQLSLLVLRIIAEFVDSIYEAALEKYQEN